MATSFALRPSMIGLLPNDTPKYEPPSSKELLGEWFIILTSLPYWNDKRNIKITYSGLSKVDTDIDTLQDDVTYTITASNKTKSIRGVNTVPKASSQELGTGEGVGWSRS